MGTSDLTRPYSLGIIYERISCTSNLKRLGAGFLGFYNPSMGGTKSVHRGGLLIPLPQAIISSSSVSWSGLEFYDIALYINSLRASSRESWRWKRPPSVSPSIRLLNDSKALCTSSTPHVQPQHSRSAGERNVLLKHLQLMASRKSNWIWLLRFTRVYPAIIPNRDINQEARRRITAQMVWNVHVRTYSFLNGATMSHNEDWGTTARHHYRLSDS